MKKLLCLCLLLIPINSFALSETFQQYLSTRPVALAPTVSDSLLIYQGGVVKQLLTAAPITIESNGVSFSNPSITTLEQARTSIYAANATVKVNNALTEAQSNITAPWPADRALEFVKGGSIANSTAFAFATGTVVIIPDNLYVFAGSGAVTGLKESMPEWFGAFADGSIGHEAVNNTAIQRAVDSISVTGGEVLFRGTYVKSGTVVVNKSFITLRGFNTGGKSLVYDLSVGQGSKVVQSDENIAFKTNVPLGTPSYPGHAYSAITYKDFNIWGPSVSGAAVGISIKDDRWDLLSPNGDATDTVLIQNMSISHIGLCIAAWNCDAPRIIGNWLCESGKAIELTGGYHGIISGNIIADNTGLAKDSFLFGGIHVSLELRALITNNTTARNIRTIFLNAVTDSIVSDNIINQDVIGIDMLDTIRNNIHHNNILMENGTSIKGIQSIEQSPLYQDVTGNDINNNIITNTASSYITAGISLYNAYSHKISENTLRGNMTNTISLYSSSNNKVLYNDSNQTLYLNIGGINNIFTHLYDYSGKMMTVSLEYTPGWTRYSSYGLTPLRYWQDAEGFCNIDGGTTGGTTGSVIFTLPWGYRPLSTKLYVVWGADTFAIVSVNADGTVKLDSGTGPIVFSDIKFDLPGRVSFQPQ